MYTQFGLVLMVTHACNLRCTYCYTGEKSNKTMPESTGRRAIERAIASMSPGGKLELSFFGGEPLLEAELIGRLIDFARERCLADGKIMALNLTTNATVVTPEAWRIMTLPELDLAISCDGLPEAHDRHRLYTSGRPSSAVVTQTIQRLVDAGRDFHVIVVVRPDTLALLPEGIQFLQKLGARHIEPSLDLWTKWTEADESRLEEIIVRCADVWRDGLPHHSIGWFDEKLAQLAKLKVTATARCGFGMGEIAVAPSGRLYPCERLIGEDRAGDPIALTGNVDDGGADFLSVRPSTPRNDEACTQCAMLSMCNTFCRCSNYVRSGQVSHPDRLLCRWNQKCLLETARVMEQLAPERNLMERGMP